MKKTSQTILFTVAILLCVAGIKAFGQSPDSSIIGVFTHLENGQSGNGSTFGVYTTNDYTLNPKSKIKIQAVGDLEIAGSKKHYRNQYGSLVRFKAAGRAWVHPRFALEAGMGLGGVYFNDTAGTNDGYTKYSLAPIAGFAAELGNGEVSALVDYNWRFKRALYAAENSLTAIREASYIDGWAGSWKTGATIEIPFKPKSKKVYTVGFNFTRAYYQRDAKAYGAVLAAEVHRYNQLGFSVGVGLRR
jgi:hypothetical protein